MNLRCALGLHDFRWPPHHFWPGDLWVDVRVECPRCGARRVAHCHPDQHWKERHPDKGDPLPPTRPNPSKRELMP